MKKKQGLYRVIHVVKDSLLLILQYELCFSLYSGGKLISCPQTVFHDPTDHLVEELEHELLLMWTSFQIYGACSHHSCVPYANRRRRLGLPRQRSTARSFKWSLLAIESLTNCMPAADSAPAHSIREGAEPLKFRRLQRCVECGLVGTAEVGGKSLLDSLQIRLQLKVQDMCNKCNFNPFDDFPWLNSNLRRDPLSSQENIQTAFRLSEPLVNW